MHTMRGEVAVVMENQLVALAKCHQTISSMVPLTLVKANFGSAKPVISHDFRKRASTLHVKDQSC